MATKTPTARVSRNSYKDYLEKAKEFYSTMQICFQDREWDSVLLLGVHAAISLNDALTVFYSGVRSTSKEHRDAAMLLSQSLRDKEGVENNIRRLIDIISEKNKVEYEPKRFQENEACEFVRQVERFFIWAKKQIPR